MTKKKTGRPSFQPTDEQRRQVEAMAGYGIPQEEICLLILNPQTNEPITKPTLEKHFRRELDTGMVKANAKVAESAFRQAVGASAVYDAQGNQLRTEQPPVPSMTIWWTKTRMGWSEKIEFEGGLTLRHEDRLKDLR